MKALNRIFVYNKPQTVVVIGLSTLFSKCIHSSRENISLILPEELSICKGKFICLFVFDSCVSVKQLASFFGSNHFSFVLIFTTVSSKGISHELLELRPVGIWHIEDLQENNLKHIYQLTFSNPPYHSPRILNKWHKAPVEISLFDQKMIRALAKGTTGKALMETLNCSKSTITKRKRLLKERFGLEGKNDCALLLHLKELGFLEEKTTPKKQKG